MHIWDAPLSRMEGESAAIALSSTATYLALKPGFKEVRLYCASAFQMAICPRLDHALYFDGQYSDHRNNVIDRSTSTHMGLDAMPTTALVYLGTTDPVRGFYLSINATNKNTNEATLDVEYCSTAMASGTAIAFTNVDDDSDGTNSGSATLATSGAYTFTLPSVVASRLGSYNQAKLESCYWYRFAPSATLSATVDIEEIIPIYQNTNYAWMQAAIEYSIPLDPERDGGLVFYIASTTPDLYVSWQK